MSYCAFTQTLDTTHLDRIYHDTEYGVPVYDDTALFERLILEINQAGLRWSLILQRREGMRAAYDNFDIATVAHYTKADIERLKNDPRIIRNRLKISAAVYNANAIMAIQQQHGSFKQWLDLHTHYNHAQWVALFRTTFKFTGGEITKEFLMSCGYLQSPHDKNCIHFRNLR